MKLNRIVFAVALLLGVASAPAQAPSAGQQAFDKLKTFVGEWEGTHGAGQRTTASYTLAANGSVIAETLRSSHDEMLTTYYLDNGRLMMTHYCGAGNQPRMVAAGLSPDGKRITFRLHDVTSLAAPTAGHMGALEVTFVDAQQFTQQWTWRENGKDKSKDVFKLTRTK